MATADDGSFERVERLRLTDWRPVPQVRLPQTVVPQAAHPVVDVHNHLGRWYLRPYDRADGDCGDAPWVFGDVGELVALMDQCNVRLIGNMDGMWGDELTANVARYDEACPGRFVTFCHLDWRVLATDGGVEALRRSLRESVERGAKGVKVWKNLGLTLRDADGALLMPDDPRVVELLAYAGELGLPVLIHTADPVAFFEPLDERNERLDELLEERSWWFGDRAVHPPFDRLYAAHRALVASCPGTTFIGAHVGCLAEDLDRVEDMLDACPNYVIDIAGRLAEIGRQPRRFAALMARYPGRVCFGSDVFPVTAEVYRTHFRFLETRDEYFPYSPEDEIPPQGRWNISALGLADDALRAVYTDNGSAVLGL